MADNDYETWTTEQLVDQSARLYDGYLLGEDNLTELSLIAEILVERDNAKRQNGTIGSKT